MHQLSSLNKQSHPGSLNPKALLSEVQIETIRTLYEEGSYKQIVLAATFGVNQSTISRIIRRQNWKNVL